MIAELAVIVIILMTVAFIYLKGSIIKAFVLLISTFIASAVALSFFETVGQFAISHDLIPEWAFAAAFIVIFAFTLAILSTIGDKLITANIYFGDAPDKIIRCFIAAFAGFAIAGTILTAAAMMPIGTSLPYERFNPKPGKSTEPQKTLILNADGFITNLVSWLSRGSLSGQKSFAVFHPSFLNEIYLNRVGIAQNNSAIATSAISVESAIAPQTPLISALDKKPVSGGAQTKAVIIKTRTEGGVFSMSQIRLICKSSDSSGDFKGSGQVFWPIGNIMGENVVTLANLPDQAGRQQMGFVFYIPTNAVPIMLEYKQNGVAEVGKLKTGVTTPPPQAPAQQTPAEHNSVK